MVHDQHVELVKGSRTIVPMTKCERRAGQKEDTSSCWSRDCVSVYAILVACYNTDRIAVEQVETLLKSQDTPDPSREASRQDVAAAYVANTVSQTVPNSTLNMSNGAGATQASRTPGLDSLNRNGGNTVGQEDIPWELIGLGLEEPLPPQDVMDEL